MMTLMSRMTRDGNEEHVMIKAVKFVSIPVKDQDQALEFYTKKLGLKVMTDSPFDGKQRWIELAIPRADTKIVCSPPKGRKR